MLKLSPASLYRYKTRKEIISGSDVDVLHVLLLS